MKLLSHTNLKIASLFAAVVFGSAITAMAQDTRVQTSQLDYLTAKASSTVDVNIDERLIQLTAKFLSTKNPDEASVKEVVNGLKGIYVRSFEFEKENEYSLADLESIRSQLRGPGWSRIVNVSSRKEGNVEVYLMINGSQIGGLAVLASEPKELTVVNVIGPVDLEKLTKLEGQFGIPELEIESSKTKRKN
ncbi:MAG TPA: DUF4252 domain-containing protein [Pyrinomonadaceae bacterium]|jgi:hypothetical protein|nr:DUF4252 domain-containing protein [Pyrinomonadaceae bacterium]